jgi:NAD(P)-dependent dehydrogenase (short-subunit alcohol dehydrogenase family)
MSDTFDPRTHNASPDELAGRVIAITGASSGIGRAVALACAKFGATVILIGRNARKLETVHGEIETAGGPEPTIAVLDLEKALLRYRNASAASMGSYTMQASLARSRQSNTTMYRPGAVSCTSMSRLLSH